MWNALLTAVAAGDTRSLARAISLVENEVEGYSPFLASLPPNPNPCPIIGITGPPGAGKSTLADALIAALVAEGKKLAILCIDPSSPFNLGALLGDRIRMSNWYNHPQVYIRSLASRGSLGGLNPRIIEITELLKAAPFDYLFVETVGVGQSEIEIAGLAELTIVVMVPEAGDEVQTMKAGLMEIADLFVVNKSDRPEADLFVKNLRLMLAPAFHHSNQEIPVIKTVATTKQGIPELTIAIQQQLRIHKTPLRRSWLLAEKVYQLIQARRMRDIDRTELQQQIQQKLLQGPFNLHAFVQQIEP